MVLSQGCVIEGSRCKECVTTHENRRGYYEVGSDQHIPVELVCVRKAASGQIAPMPMELA
jgi:hypothetical protein